MGQYDFDYRIPDDFARRVILFLESRQKSVSAAFQNCTFETNDVGNAYRAGIRGDNWNMNAVDFVIEGNKTDIELLSQFKPLLKETFSKAIKSRESGFQVRNIDLLPV